MLEGVNGRMGLVVIRRLKYGSCLKHQGLSKPLIWRNYSLSSVKLAEGIVPPGRERTFKSFKEKDDSGIPAGGWFLLVRSSLLNGFHNSFYKTRN